jgi:hypothetical protein
MPLPESELVIYFHVFYNLIRCVAMVPFAEPMARLCKRMIREDPEQDLHLKPKHLDTTALDTPALALANAARETLRIGDAMEQMLEGLHKVMHGEPREEKELRRLADDINVLYTAIKLYLARMPKDELAEEESRRWAEIIEMALNLEQASDIVERMGSEIADKSLAARRAFSVGAEGAGRRAAQQPAAGDVGLFLQRCPERPTPAPQQASFPHPEPPLLARARRPSAPAERAEYRDQLAASGVTGGYETPELVVLLGGL